MNHLLYGLWLPITNFNEFYLNLKNSHPTLLNPDMPQINSNWSWIIFEYDKVALTVDSLGFIYLR